MFAKRILARIVHTVQSLYMLLAILEYRFLRAMKWKLYRGRMRYTKRGAARMKLLVRCVLDAFDPILAAQRVVSVSFPHRGYTAVEHGKIYWEAPLGISVWDKEKPLCGMAVEFWNDTLCIRQLQGVKGVQMTKELSAWPRVFVEACLVFAKEAGFRRVRLYRADQSIFYWHPQVEGVPPEDYERARQEIRDRMRRRYDGTARQMGFVLERRWGEWTNPEWVRSR